jgi:WD40 repeat protein
MSIINADEQINSLRFSKSGKLLCAVSNDGSANAWAYPLAEVSRAPSPSEGVQVVDAAKMDEAAEGEGRDEDERKSRASTPREGTPVEEEGKATNDENAGEASTIEPAAGDEPSQVTETSTAQADTTDVEMTDVSNTVGGIPAEEETETDIEMPVASSSQAVKSVTIASPPSGLSAPSRVPTPPPATASTTIQAKVTPLKCLRHTICHSASLLSLSFDPSGKCVSVSKYGRLLIIRFMAIGGQDAMLSLFDTQDWICQRTFDMCT